MCTAAYKGKEKSCLLCTCPLTLSLLMLKVSSIIFRNLILPSFKKICLLETVNFLERSQYLPPLNKLFYFKSLRFKVSQNTFFLKLNVRSTLYFSVIPYFEKTSCAM